MSGRVHDGTKQTESLEGRKLQGRGEITPYAVFHQIKAILYIQSSNVFCLYKLIGSPSWLFPDKIPYKPRIKI